MTGRTLIRPSEQEGQKPAHSRRGGSSRLSGGVFADLPRNHFGAIYADPPWAFAAWSGDKLPSRVEDAHYRTMSMADIESLPVSQIAADDCALFLWICWPTMPDALTVIRQWGFEYKTCAFAWLKGDARQRDFFAGEVPAQVGMGYWTRANSEVCLLATRGKPKRLNADVRQGIIEPRREHSRKPACVYDRIERLVAGPYLELFSRTSRPGWTMWGNEVGKFEGAA